MEQKSGNRMNEATFVNAARLMFKKAKRGNTIYSAFSKNSSHALVFIVDMSIIISIALVDLLLKLPTRVQEAYVPIYITRIILSPMIVVRQMMKNVKNVPYNHMATCLLGVKYRI